MNSTTDPRPRAGRLPERGLAATLCRSAGCPGSARVILLYQFEISPFCDKVRRILHYKELPYPVLICPGFFLWYHFRYPLQCRFEYLFKFTEIILWYTDIYGAYLAVITGAGVVYIAHFFAAKSDSLICFYSISQDLTVIRVYSGRHIYRIDPGTVFSFVGIIYHPYDAAGRFPDGSFMEPGTENCIDYKIGFIQVFYKTALFILVILCYIPRVFGFQFFIIMAGIR